MLNWHLYWVKSSNLHMSLQIFRASFNSCHWCVLFRKLYAHVVFPFCNRVVSFSNAEFWEYLIYSRYKSFVRYVTCKYFLSLSFSFLLTVCFTKHFDKVQFFLLWIMLLMSSLGTLGSVWDHKNFLLFFLEML